MTTVQPEPADVLCGRGENSFRHGGNYQFRQLIVENANSYKMAATRKQKTQVVVLVATAIIAMGGRFLIRNTDGKSWRDGGLKQGKLKAGHAFRDALRGRVKCLAQKTTRNQGRTAGEGEKNEEAKTRQINNLTLKKMNSCCSFSLMSPLCCAAVEPSKDWMTARMDAELEKYLRNIFFLSECDNW